MKVRYGLERCACLKERGLVEWATDDLHANRQTVKIEAALHC